jgi:DNA-binding MarR family transcriptional regulator
MAARVTTPTEPMVWAEDPVLLVQVAARLVSERMMRDLDRAGLDDVREADGFVFQHLETGPVSIGDLAVRLGVSQQAVSKSVADLERRGYVLRSPSVVDARVREVSLTARGAKAIDVGRRSRAAVRKELDDALGDRRAASLRRSLVAVIEQLGGFDALARRSRRAPR